MSLDQHHENPISSRALRDGLIPLSWVSGIMNEYLSSAMANDTSCRDEKVHSSESPRRTVPVVERHFVAQSLSVSSGAFVRVKGQLHKYTGKGSPESNVCTLFRRDENRSRLECFWKVGGTPQSYTGGPPVRTFASL